MAIIAHQGGTRRQATCEHIETVTGSGARTRDEDAVALLQLMVERQAIEMRAAHDDLQGTVARFRQRYHGRARHTSGTQRQA